MVGDTLTCKAKKFVFHCKLLTIFFYKFSIISYFFISFEWSILSFLLSLLSKDASKPKLLTASMISRGPVVSVSYTNRPLLVAKETDASSMPGLFFMLDSIEWTQEEHVIPVIWNVNKKSRTTIRKSIIKFAMVTQHGYRGWNRTYTPNDISPVDSHSAHERLYHITRVYAPYSLWTAVWVLLHPKRIRTVEELWHVTYSFSSLSEKLRKSNHLHMSQQRQRILDSYFSDPEHWNEWVNYSLPSIND